MAPQISLLICSAGEFRNLVISQTVTYAVDMIAAAKQILHGLHHLAVPVIITEFEHIHFIFNVRQVHLPASR